MGKKLIHEDVLIHAEEITNNTNKIKIQDRGYYEKYLKLKNSKILKMKLQTMSNGVKISLGRIHGFEELIDKLPETEKTKLRTLKKLYRSTVCKMNVYKHKAFGTQINQNGEISVRSDIFAQRKTEMVELFGRMFTVQEVHKVCLETWDIPCQVGAVRDFRTNHWKEIEPKVEQHKRDYSDIRLGYKRSRLEELSYLYRTRLNIHNDTKRADDHRLLLQTLEQIRKECEGDVMRIDGTFNVNVDLTIQEHIQEEIRKTLPLKEIIIGRVSARMGIDPNKILSDLNKMYYSKYLDAEELKYEDMPAYPSNQTYDFERIRKINQQREKEREREKSSTRIMNEENTERAQTLKELIMSKIQRQRQKVAYVKNNLQGEIINHANTHRMIEDK